MAEDKTALENAEQSEDRVIEVNEWFTPFEDYESIPYDTSAKLAAPGKVATLENQRVKGIYFRLANIGRFKVGLWWNEHLVDPKEASESEKYLLVLPASSKLISGKELHKEQERMETRPMQFDIDYDGEDLPGKTLPFVVEAELPSGEVVSAKLTPPHKSDIEAPSTFENWQVNDTPIDSIMVPDVANIAQRIRIRVVPKE